MPRQAYAVYVEDAIKANKAYTRYGGSLVIGSLLSVATQDDDDPAEVGSWDRGVAPSAFLELAGAAATKLSELPDFALLDWDVIGLKFVPKPSES